MSSRHFPSLLTPYPPEAPLRGSDGVTRRRERAETRWPERGAGRDMRPLPFASHCRLTVSLRGLMSLYTPSSHHIPFQPFPLRSFHSLRNGVVNGVGMETER